MRTINRQPYSVKQLNYGDIKYKFFNHSNWKGVCDDKNYLSIDQETFADSNNMYVDSEGILRSRPSLKLMTIEGLQDIVDVWTFGPWQVYQVGSKDSYELVFRKDNTIAKSNIAVSNEFKLVFADEKVFVFEKNNLSYFDTVTNEFFTNATSKIYVPVTKAVKQGAYTDSESPNVLTTSYITQYLYNTGDTLYEIKGKHATVKIDDDVYTVTFDTYTTLTFVNKIFQLMEKNYMDGEPLVFTNYNTGIVMIAEWNDDTAYTLYWSRDDTVFKPIPALEGQLPKDYTLLPAISQSADHVYAVLYKDDGPYAYTIYAPDKESSSLFNTWTYLIKDFSPPVADYVSKISYKGYVIDETESIKGVCGYYIDETTYGVLLAGYYIYPTSDVHSARSIDYRYIEGKVSIQIVKDSYYTGACLCKVYCDNAYYIRVWQIGTGKGIHPVNYGIIRSTNETKYTVVDNFATSYVYSYPTSNNHVNTNIKYSNQICITGIQGEIHMCCLLPKNVGSIFDGRTEAVQLCIQDLVFKYDIESFELSTERNFIYLPDDAKLDVIYSSSGQVNAVRLSSVNYILYAYLTKILTFKYLVYNHTSTMLLFEGVPSGITSLAMYITKDNVLYSSKLKNKVTIDVTTEGELNFDVFDHEAELSNYFISKGKNLYINAQGQNIDVGDFKWYFPERNVQEFDYEITNLHPISTTEIAVFLKDSIYYVKPTTITLSGIETLAYSYYKSRIPLGCEEGSDIITSYDNKYTMFVTKRGFVAMSYQDFIASEEQALTFLSDTIYDLFNKWNIGGIKLCQYNFWIILYRPGVAKAFIFDMRSNSWWPVEYNTNGRKLIEIDRKLYLLNDGNNSMYYFDKSNEKYYDGNKPETGRINWHLASQKLHLSAINYYKHIVNLTLYGYNYDNKELLTKFNLRVINYRKQTDTNEIKSFESVEYTIELTRTFVKRINYYKVNQVQYILESCRDIDQEDAVPTPLCLTAISLKYLVTGQVR